MGPMAVVFDRRQRFGRLWYRKVRNALLNDMLIITDTLPSVIAAHW
jgi:hypothetical protein